MSKLTLLLAGAAGYVLGARAGRQRYEQIAAGARAVARNPKVQSVTHQAQEAVSEQAAHMGERAKDAASSFAHTAADKVRGNGGAHAQDWPSATPPPSS